MSGNDGKTAATGDDAGRPGWRAAWPFLVALLVVVVGVGAIGISHLLRPPADRMSDDAKVRYAINEGYTARSNIDYDRFIASTCAADLAAGKVPDKATFVRDNRKSAEAGGRLVIPEITDIAIKGDRATAQVHWHFEKKPDQKQTASAVVVAQNGDWKVCSS